MSTSHEHGHGPAGGVPETPRFDREWWDERYGSKDSLWSGRENPSLEPETAGLTPGRALDVGCGEGADAIWLAAHGWRVLGVDVSVVALERAAIHAAAAGTEIAGRIAWEQHNLLAWVPEPGTFDLVSAQFFHLLASDRVRVYAGLAGAVAPGGTLLVVGHSFEDLGSSMHRPHDPELYASAEDLAAPLDPAQWDIEVCETRQRAATNPDGEEVTIADAVVRARRR